MAKDEFNMADLVGSIKRQKVQSKDILGSNENASSMTTNNKKLIVSLKY